MPVKTTQFDQKARERLEKLFGNPSNDSVTPYERVENAIQHRQPDRVPFDFWAVPEIIDALRSLLNAKNDEEFLQLLGIDCRLVRPTYIGPTPERFADGSFFTPWGSHRRLVSNEFSTYEEYASFPLADAKSADEIKRWSKWPKTDFWDWQSIIPQIEQLNQTTRYHIRYEVGGIFESSWALYGLDRFLMDLMDKPEIPCAIMDCYTDLMIANVESLMKAAKGKIDMVYTYDDVAVQRGLMMSPAMWRKYILPRHKRLNTVIKDHGLKIMYHSCGAIYRLIPELIDEMWIDVLNPLQPRAAMMDMQKIKTEFGSRVAFHGGIDLQETMAHGTVNEVVNEASERISILGKGGGYICTTAHYIQADTPLENIIALYTTQRN
jgi:uroporphyrinogen decarboxylase